LLKAKLCGVEIQGMNTNLPRVNSLYIVAGSLPLF
jgi:hypothetical protein